VIVRSKNNHESARINTNQKQCRGNRSPPVLERIEPGIQPFSIFLLLFVFIRANSWLYFFRETSQQLVPSFARQMGHFAGTLQIVLALLEALFIGDPPGRCFGEGRFGIFRI